VADKTLTILINAKDQVSGPVGRIQNRLGGLKSAFGTIAKVGAGAMIGLGGAAIAAGAGIVKLASDAAKLEPIERDFTRLAESIGETTDAMLGGMREASYGMVADADLMESANRLISMGLAGSAEEASNLTRMAVRLGESMGKGPTEAMEEFALMMANQSIPRLDTFGISAGKVRGRINELMAANKALSREEAFAIAVREEGAKSLERIGEGGQGAAADMARLQASFKNIKDQVGKAFIPVLAALLEPLGDLAQEYGPRVIEWAERFSGWLERSGIPALRSFVVGLSDIFKTLISYIVDVGLAGGPLDDWLAELPEPIQNITHFVGEMMAKFVKFGKVAIPIVLDFGQKASAWLGENVPKAMAVISGFWTGTLKPALEALASYWNETLQPALAIAATWLGENVPVAMEAISTFWAGTLRPAIEEIVAWLGENVPVAMEAISTFWEQTLRPALEIAATWFGENLPVAMEAITTFWNETLRPTVEKIAMWLGENIPIAMQAISDFWHGTLQPALSDLWDWLSTYLFPAVEALSRVVKELVRIGFEALYIMLTEKVIPFLKDTWEWLSEKLKPATDTLKEAVGPLSGVLETFAGVLETVQGWLEGLTTWANNAAAALANVKLLQGNPLKPGSPSPLERSLRGIANAAHDATAAIGSMALPTGGLGGFGGLAPAGVGGAGGRDRTIIIAPFSLDPRQYTDARGATRYHAIAELLKGLEESL
jgi:hypothetical protein